MSPEELLGKVDPLDLAHEMSQLVVEVLSGKIEYVEHQITLKIPKKISAVFEKVLDKYDADIDIKDLYSHMASHGLTESLNVMTRKVSAQEEASKPQPETPADPLADLPQMKKIQQQMGQLSKVVEQFQSLSKVMENVSDNLSEGQSSKNPK